MRATPSWSAKIPYGSSILRCMNIGWRLHFRLGLCGRLRLADGADHVQRTFRIVLEFIAQNAFAAVERILAAHQLALDAGKLLRGKERLRQESLQLTRTAHHFAILGRQLLQSEHRDDVLEILVLR